MSLDELATFGNETFDIDPEKEEIGEIESALNSRENPRRVLVGAMSLNAIERHFHLDDKEWLECMSDDLLKALTEALKHYLNENDRTYDPLVAELMQAVTNMQDANIGVKQD